MGNAKSDVALALLLLSHNQKSLKMKAMRIFENECKREFSENNWSECLKLILIGGMLRICGYLKDDGCINLYKQNTRVHKIITSYCIDNHIQHKDIINLLFHFLTYPLYQISLNLYEKQKLYDLCNIISKRIMEGCTFVTESKAELCQLYIIVALLNKCYDTALVISKDLIAKYIAGQIIINYPLSILINKCIQNQNIELLNIPHISVFVLNNIMGIREMTNCVLAEKLCDKKFYTERFLYDTFISREYLLNRIANDNRRFSLDSGISRILLTYSLSTQEVDPDVLKLMAMVLMAL